MNINNIMNINNKRKGIYVHIPFCVQKCIYCDFNSYPGYTENEKKRYFDALYKECDLLPLEMVEKADTAFIGGGTPTSVESSYIKELMRHLELAENSEVTIEANPGTLTEDKLRDYLHSGVNRLSLGVQSLNDEDLRFLGRIHNAGDVFTSYEMARKAGFKNINIDLIFGFPGHTLEKWKNTLDKVIKLNPEHISFYSLQIEEGTKMYELFRNEEVEQISDELNREMYHYALKVLKENGYMHYEISNAAKPGFQCRHNLKYWSMTPYIGIGAGAHSYYEGARFFNPENISEYIKIVDEKWVAKLSGNPKFITIGTDYYENTISDTVTDYLFTGLRRICGINLSDFSQKFGFDFFERYGEKIKSFISQGYVEESNGYLRFTEKGLDITNYIIAELM